MGVFIFMYAVFVGLYFLSFDWINAQKQRLYKTIICTTILVVIQGFRNETIGVDSYNVYRPYFDMLPGTLESLWDFSDTFANFEVGYCTLTKLIKLFTDDTQIYILICSILSIVPISYSIYKHSTNVVFSFIIFASFIVYHFGFSGIRQAIAIGLTVISYEFLLKQDKWKFVLCVLLASSFHTSAILFLIAYPCCHYLKISDTKMLILMFLFIGMLPFIKPLATMMVSLIFGGDKYVSYISKDVEPSYNLMILLFCLFLLSFISKDSRVVTLRIMIFIAVCFQSLGLLSNAATRIAYYFYIYLPIILPLSISTSKYRKSILNVALMAFMIFFYFYSNSSGYLDVIPYRFCWE